MIERSRSLKLANPPFDHRLSILLMNPSKPLKSHKFRGYIFLHKELFAMFIVIGALLGFLIAMLMEYFLHRFYLHFSGQHMHITLHHKKFHGNRSYSIPDSEYNEIVSGWFYILFSMLPCGITAWYFTRYSLLGAFCLAACGISYILWIEYVHYLFHKPADQFIETTSLFKQIKEHHRLHHVVFNQNFGIGSTFMDHIFRSLEK